MGTAVNYSLINNLFPLSTCLPGSVPVTINNSSVVPQWFGPSLVIHSGALLWPAIEARTGSFSYSLIPAAALLHVPDWQEIALMGSTVRCPTCPLSPLTAHRAFLSEKCNVVCSKRWDTLQIVLSRLSPGHIDFTGSVTLKFIWTSICSNYLHTSV